MEDIELIHLTDDRRDVTYCGQVTKAGFASENLEWVECRQCLKEWERKERPDHAELVKVFFGPIPN